MTTLVPGTGCRVDKRPDVFGRAKSAMRRKRLLGGSLIKPERSIDWRDHYLMVRQRGNSCTGFARSQAVRVFLAIRGVTDPPWWDPYRNYWYSRRKHRIHEQDAGSYIRSAFWAGRFGDVAKMPNVYPGVLAPPADTDDARAVDVAVKAERIFATGDELCWRIGDSIARRQPCVIGLDVARDFLDRDGPSFIEHPTDATLDLGHAVAIIGCIPYENFPPDAIIGNSWGSWRQAGTAILSHNYVGRSFDVWFIRSVKWAGKLYT